MSIAAFSDQFFSTRYKHAAGLLFLIAGLFAATAIAGPAISESDGVVTVEDAPAMEVLAYGKTIVVKQRAKGVVSFGGDVIVEGSVETDVAAIGGSVIQKESGYIGGDVIVLGGKYVAEGAEPKREPGRETIMYAGYEDEFRDLVLNPNQLFSPTLSTGYLVSRLVSTIFWFAATLLFAAIFPRFAGRAAAKLRLSPFKIPGIGLALIAGLSITAILASAFLPGYVGALIGLLTFTILIAAYFFGRITLQLVLGKLLLKLFPFLTGSETLTIAAGTIACALVLSIPYSWPLMVLLLIASGAGLAANRSRSAA